VERRLLERVFDCANWVNRLEDLIELPNSFLIAVENWMPEPKVSIIGVHTLLTADQLFVIETITEKEASPILSATIIQHVKELARRWRVAECSELIHQSSKVAIDFPNAETHHVVISFAKDKVLFIEFLCEGIELKNYLIYVEFLGHFLSLYSRSHKSRNHQRSEPVFSKSNWITQNLSLRQIQITEMIALGIGNRQIAKELGYSESLIRKETMVIFQYFGIKSRKELLGKQLDFRKNETDTK